MATKEKLRERVLRRDHYICQFPNFYEGFVCASSKNVVVHAIEPTNWAAANFLDFEKIPLDQKNAPDTLKLLKIIQEIRANPQKAFNYQELFFNVGLLSRILLSLENHIVLCSDHHNLLYEELREESSDEDGRINWQIFNKLALEKAMQRIVYWDESYDEFFKERAGRNRSLAYQHLTQETH